MEPSAGTLASVKDCMWLPSLVRPAQCECDISWLNCTFLEGLKQFVRQVFNENVSVVRNVCVQKMAKSWSLILTGMTLEGRNYYGMPGTSCVQQRFFLPCLCISSSNIPETFRRIRWGGHFRYHNSRKSDEGGSIQWT